MRLFPVLIQHHGKRARHGKRWLRHPTERETGRRSLHRARPGRGGVRARCVPTGFPTRPDTARKRTPVSCPRDENTTAQRPLRGSVKCNRDSTGAEITGGGVTSLLPATLLGSFARPRLFPCKRSSEVCCAA